MNIFLAGCFGGLYQHDMTTKKIPSINTGTGTSDKSTGWRGSREVWLDAARQVLIESGVDAVKIQPLAARLAISRTSFYWFFKDRTALLEALLDDWEARNTGAFITACSAYAETIAEGLLNLISVYHHRNKFDPEMDFAVRAWAQGVPEVKARLQRADVGRLDAIRGLFTRFGFDAEEADVRANTVYLTQIGYIALQVSEDQVTRVGRVPAYVQTFCGTPPTSREMARFKAGLPSEEERARKDKQ